jgi:hypothetical protein
MQLMGSGKKSAKKRGPGKPFQKGPDERRGNGPAEGEGGRPLKMYQERMRKAAEVANIEAILADPNHSQFMRAYEHAVDRGFGKVAERVEHVGEGGGPIAMTIKFVGAKK